MVQERSSGKLVRNVFYLTGTLLIFGALGIFVQYRGWVPGLDSQQQVAASEGQVANKEANLCAGDAIYLTNFLDTMESKFPGHAEELKKHAEIERANNFDDSFRQKLHAGVRIKADIPDATSAEIGAAFFNKCMGNTQQDEVKYPRAYTQYITGMRMFIGYPQSE